MDRDQGVAIETGHQMSDAPLTLRLLSGKADEMAALQAVLEAAPTYFHTATGLPPGPAEAQSTFTALPAGKIYDDKRVWGLYGYPVHDKAVIGLLLLAEAWQRRGIGRAFALLVEQAIAVWPEIVTLRIGVVEQNVGAQAFWRKLGYVETGEVKHAEVRDVFVMEKPLARN
ncbi:MAG: GNAT family N-acetyltransferase [Betaproteobacteria bacterium]|nr:MAG: GNAT family N-acetyltransferase [Betaproteobacteria bacterium]